MKFLTTATVFLVSCKPNGQSNQTNSTSSQWVGLTSLFVLLWSSAHWQCLCSFTAVKRSLQWTVWCHFHLNPNRSDLIPTLPIAPPEWQRWIFTGILSSSSTTVVAKTSCMCWAKAHAEESSQGVAQIFSTWGPTKAAGKHHHPNVLVY